MLNISQDSLAAQAQRVFPLAEFKAGAAVFGAPSVPSYSLPLGQDWKLETDKGTSKLRSLGAGVGDGTAAGDGLCLRASQEEGQSSGAVTLASCGGPGVDWKVFPSAEAAAQQAPAVGGATCPGNFSTGVCLHNAYPILSQRSTVSPAECCGNCTQDPKCVSWNVNSDMKQCFLRGSFKTNPGKQCISGLVRPAPPPPPHPGCVQVAAGPGKCLGLVAANGTSEHMIAALVQCGSETAWWKHGSTYLNMTFGSLTNCARPLSLDASPRATTNVFAGPLSGGRWASLLLNRGDVEAEVSLDLRGLPGMAEGSAKLEATEVWSGTAAPISGAVLKRTLQAHASFFAIIAPAAHTRMKLDDDAVVSCVDWCEPPLAKSTAVNSVHDVTAGAAGGPLHDDVYPPSSYDIVDAINDRRRELGSPLNRAWWDGSVVLDWPANSSTPDRKAVWCPEPTRPNKTHTSWDLRALDVKMLNLQRSVAFPETTILQLRFPPPWVWAPGNATTGLADPSGVELGEHYSRIISWYKGGFTDELGRRHDSGYNVSFGYLEILNEIDGNSHIYGPRSPVEATRRYIRLYDGVATTVRRDHPEIKFVGGCLSGRGDEDDSIVWRTFLNRSEHSADVPWPVDAVSFHLYIGGTGAGPFSAWPAQIIEGARGVVPSAVQVTKAIKALSPTTRVFCDEMGILFQEPVREAMNFSTMRGGGGNTSFWNLHSAIYALWAGEMAAAGVDMFGASQLLGYPAGPPGTPVGVPGPAPERGTPFQPQVTPDGNCPEVRSLLSWRPPSTRRSR